jgi:hypothetical protein
MPRKKGRKGGGKGSDSCTVPFHYTLSSAFTAGILTLFANPASFPRVLVEADAWAHFRIRKLAFRLMPTSPSTVAQAIGYVGGIQDTPPGSFSQISELIPSAIKGVGQTVPSSWVHVPRVDLAGPFPWYKTIAGSADSTEESPGQIIAVGTGTEAVVIEFKGQFEFKTALAAANTPSALKFFELVRKERIESARSQTRDRLLAILATSKTVP